ncbi:hypothetical protein R1flu_013409 [Riccia fluitans]|uniref:Uncharacterized protein n=1 Tax=Riccia fluitans TaxID=41844 RepID=A0ABD1YDA7_9MARC
MSGTVKEDQAFRDVVRDPDLPCIVPGETSEASMARYSEQMVAVVKHWTMEKADGKTDALTSVIPSVVMLAKFFLNQIPQVPGLTIPAPATDRIDELQVLCAAMASWAGDLKQEVAEDRRIRSILTERANGAQAERDAARQKYELSVSPHPALGELMEAMDARIQSAKKDAARLREHTSQIMSEWQNSNIQWRTSLNKVQVKVDKQTEDLKALRETYCLITTPEEPTARDLVECLVLQNSIADHRAEEAEREYRSGTKSSVKLKDELRRAREELAQNRADGEKQSGALEEELRRVRNDVVQREEETGRWIRNDEKMADFVREIARLRDKLLTKDAKMRELEKTLRERPEEIQPGQIESAQKEFHDVEQRFALVESPDLSDISLPSFSPVLVETLRKTLDTKFELMKQLQSMQRATPGKGETGRPGAGVIHPAGSSPAATRAVPAGEGGGGHTDTGAGYSAGTCPAAVGEVRTKADLEAAYADLDTVQAQLDEEHERNSKLQERVRALEKEIRAMRRQALLRPSLSVDLPDSILRRSVGEFPALTPRVLRTGD